MWYAQDAMVAREQGDTDEANRLIALALPLEVQACELIEKAEKSEPTRSILYLSAASLAQTAGDVPYAQRLIGEGLAGWPNPRTAYGLKELLYHLDPAQFEMIREDAQVTDG